MTVKYDRFGISWSEEDEFKIPTECLIHEVIYDAALGECPVCEGSETVESYLDGSIS